MTEVFYSVLKASFQGSIVILAVMLLRPVLKRTPRNMICLLWLLAGLRLILPFEIQSNLSLQPPLDDASFVVQTEQHAQAPEIIMPSPDGQPLSTPEIPSQLPALPEANGDGPKNEDPAHGVQNTGISKSVSYRHIAAQIWLIGIGAMLVSGEVSYLRLKRRVREACLTETGCYRCPGLETAFVLGFLRPRIYLPSDLTELETKFVLDHEKAHIARRDHWAKLMGYIILSLHWFNPLVWIGYTLLCRDLELACDERVVSRMDLSQRKQYSHALLNCSGKRSYLRVSPLAFGEKPVYGRIKAVLNYRKPAFYLTCLGAAALVIVAVCFLTEPKEQEIPETTSPAETTPSEPQEAETIPSEPQYPNGFEDYVYRYSDPRDRAWEEDIVYMANIYLTQFPKVAKTSCFEYRMYEENSGAYLITDNRRYEEDLRIAFIQATYDLLDRIPELNDTQLTYEIIRTKGTMQSTMTGGIGNAEAYFPIAVEPLEHNGQIGYYAVVVCQGQEDLLGKRLTAINGIPLAEVLEMLQPYALNENANWDQFRLTGNYYNSFIVNQTLLQSVGILDWNTDTAEYTFVSEDGAETVAALTAVRQGETRPALAWEDAYKERTYYTGAWTDDDPYYWYELMPEENVLYVRVRRSREHSGYAFQTFLREVTNILNSAETPMKLIIDIRGNTGGTYPMSGYDDFVKQMPKIQHEGIWFLVDHSVGSSSWMFNLMELYTDVTVAGTPTGSAENNWGGIKTYQSPNHNLPFYVPTQYWMFCEHPEGTARIPDIIIYQTLEDHRQGIDTLRTYVTNIDS